MKIIVANWKSHKNWSDAETWLRSVKPSAAEVQVIVAPPMPLLGLVAHHLSKKSGLELAVQDVSPFPAGSYTGATSVKNLEGFNVKWAVIGHSERRRYFHETNQEIANKVDQALAGGMVPIVCVDQPDVALQMAAIEESLWKKCVIAYEPLAAIGSGKEELLEKVEEVVNSIRQKYKPWAVIYGGSVSATNIATYLTVCDGALVATHSLDVEDFNRVLVAS